MNAKLNWVCNDSLGYLCFFFGGGRGGGGVCHVNNKKKYAN